MDVFGIRDRLIDDYESFTTSFVEARDERIAHHLDERLKSGSQWPDPWLSLNPFFQSGGTITDCIKDGLLHQRCAPIFRVKNSLADQGERELTLHQHQRDAIEAARTGQSYVLTTGTGSGKSLAYIVPIVDRVLMEREANPKAPPSIKAIVVYPMNALANSQLGELEKFLTFGFGKGNEPVTYARYTGQESDEDRQRIMANPPDILLTNYMMLELLLTRPQERDKLIRAANDLRFLVLDELHTYRGRQGADVAMLVRRLRQACAATNLQCVGTSATMASGGTRQEQREAVSAVATRLFGTDVSPDRVIGETLIRGTGGPDDDVSGLRRSLAAAKDPSFEQLVADPLASWIETTFGLATDPDTNQLIRQRPTTVDRASKVLAELIDESQAACATAIRETLQAGSQARHPITDRPLFAFRIHQFVSKGDNVYSSIEEPATRHITSKYQVAVPHSPEKFLVPLTFCRECGQEYLAVVRDETDGDIVFRARQDRDASGHAGYLYVSDDLPWPAASDNVSLFDRLPDSWLTEDKNGNPAVVDTKRKRLPRLVRVFSNGTQTANDQAGATPGNAITTTDGVLAAFVPSPFSFCLRCGTSYEQRGNEYARLASVASEGRSSAVTVLTTSIVRSLKAVTDPDFPEAAKKLLTFVDNRQDASLQSGHVNDFAQVSQLRAALARAVSKAGPDGLTSQEIGDSVTTELDLRFDEFSIDPDPAPRIRKQREEAMRSLVAYRIYADLERGWRINMPNLEQTGLLVIDYEDVDWLASNDTRWEGTHAAIRDAAPNQREQLLKILLDELRRSLALESPLLAEATFEKIRLDANNNLREPWSMDIEEKMANIRTAYARGATGGKGTPRWVLNLSGRGALGMFIRKRSNIAAANPGLDIDDAQLIITDLLRATSNAGIVREFEDDHGERGYRLNIDALRWKAGTGQHGIDDVLRRNITVESGARVNPFFRDLYQRSADRLTGLLAREHTAQVPAKVREERETRFRAGTLPMLFCSPTMELGVDIASLNAVAMRNVPPTPANYAQRSGRAGRSGQPALVVTYCATGNSHDSYYFARSDQMVSGAVAPPRLDLGNEDLIRSHVHAIWLAATGVALKSSMMEIIDGDGESPSLEVRDHVGVQLNDPKALAKAASDAEAVVAAIAGDLADASWFDEEWVGRTVKQAPAAFSKACERWRELYRSAASEQYENNKVVNDASASTPARKAAARRRGEAEAQLRLLRNEDSGQALTDFYPYRYFASEGFLPGYSFPRLPLAAFIPGARARMDSGDFLQRARFLAVSEFGPGSLIYHEGARYQVERVQLPPGDPSQPGSIDTTSMRRCESCGYLHDRSEIVDVCAHCGENLGGATEGLLALRTVFTRRRERISSDEEERRRTGFELQFSYRFADRGAKPGNADATAISATGEPLLTLSYGNAATIRVANLGERRRAVGKPNGFFVNTTNGRWLSDAQADQMAGTPMGELDEAGNVTTKARVIPYVEDTRNILVVRLAEPADEIITTTLRHALERGIESEFQLEDSELSSQSLPDDHHRGRSLLIEANEGGAGVLRRVGDEPDALARAARRALEIAHFSPEGMDLLADASDEERCEKACYTCLLSYSNQTEHLLIDRHRVRDLLLELATGTTKRDEAATGSEHLADLQKRCDSTLEREFLDHLVAHDHRLPTTAQIVIKGAQARPDFIYDTANGRAAVFIDGPHHDNAHIAMRDSQARERLDDMGWSVITIRYDDDFTTKLAEYQSVFGQGR